MTIAVTLVLLGILFITLGAPLVSGSDPYAGNVLARLKPIGTPGHWLGTDETGRDLWTRALLRRAAVVAGGGTAGDDLFGAWADFLGILRVIRAGIVGTLIMRTMDVVLRVSLHSYSRSRFVGCSAMG